jgi:acyl-CoA thioester hydrolase
MNQNNVFRHSCPIQVRFTDIDQMAHVTNSIYLAYCDIARLDYFTTVFGEQIGQTEESLVIASVTVDFLKPIFLYEKINVLTKTVRIGNKSLQMLQQVVNPETEEVKAEVLSVVAGFNYSAQESIVVPERWKKSITAFDSGIEFKK